jgi:acyl dehydratase
MVCDGDLGYLSDNIQLCKYRGASPSVLHPGWMDRINVAHKGVNMTIDVTQLHEHLGERLGTSQWHRITQDQIDRFADDVQDHHPVHVDPEYARRGGFGGTIAHGPFVLSLGPKFLYEFVDLTTSGVTLLYGFDRIRFVSPVPVDSRIRMTADLKAIDELPNGSRFTFVWTFENEGHDRPAVIAENILVHLDPAPTTN